jgi:hypothetical protein
MIPKGDNLFPDRILRRLKRTRDAHGDFIRAVRGSA